MSYNTEKANLKDLYTAFYKGELKDTSQLKKKRRDIARLLTQDNKTE